MSPLQRWVHVCECEQYVYIERIPVHHMAFHELEKKLLNWTSKQQKKTGTKQFQLCEFSLRCVSFRIRWKGVWEKIGDKSIKAQA